MKAIITLLFLHLAHSSLPDYHHKQHFEIMKIRSKQYLVFTTTMCIRVQPLHQLKAKPFVLC